MSDQDNELETMLASITREDGTQKYQSPEDAVKALIAAQQHISTLENENAQYKEQVGKISTIEETLERLANSSKTQDPSPKPKEDTSSPKELNRESIEEIVAKQFQSYNQQQQKEANRRKFESSLKTVAGDKYEEILKSKASDLGVNVDFIKDLSATSPEAAMRLVKDQIETPPRPSDNGMYRPTKFTAPQERVNVAGMSSRDRIAEIERRIQLAQKGAN